MKFSLFLVALTAAFILPGFKHTACGQYKEASSPSGYLNFLVDMAPRFDTTAASAHQTVSFHEAPEWRAWHQVHNFEFGKDRGSLPMIADVRSLHPVFRDKILTLIARCQVRGIELRMVEGFRTRAKQAEYFNMGKQYTLTKGGKSKHQYGLAADLVPFINGEPQWDNKILWKKIGAIGESLGLRWGGRWKTLYDPAHFEWTGGVSLSQLSNGIFPAINDDGHYPCLDDDLAYLRQAWEAWETEQSMFARETRK